MKGSPLEENTVQLKEISGRSVQPKYLHTECEYIDLANFLNTPHLTVTNSE